MAFNANNEAHKIICELIRDDTLRDRQLVATQEYLKHTTPGNRKATYVDNKLVDVEQLKAQNEVLGTIVNRLWYSSIVVFTVCIVMLAIKWFL